MLPLPRGAIWQLLFLFCVALYINEVRSDGRVVCYYTNWSVYRPGTAKFNPQNINPYLCTHLIYAFGGFTKDNQMKPFDKYQDIEQGGYAKFTGLKTYNKQLKTMIAIGGWNEASSRFSPLVANSERRQKFIKNILKFLRQNHFDGIDLDWEYPAHREGGKPRDKENYAQFVQELRAEFERESEKTGRPRLLLTMAVPAGIEYIEKGYDIPKLNKYLDWFNLLTYDFHSSHEPSVNHHAPLYSLEEESEYNYDAELNIDYSVKFYLNAGADRDKLVLGIPTYGRSFTLINEESTEIGAPAEAPGDQGDATREKGYLAYYEICQNIKEDPEWTVVQPNPNAMGPYAFHRNQWVGYDDEAIVRKKAQYVVDNGLGGIMFWAIDNDDFRGTCTGKPYPLIEAAKDAMLEALGLGINEVTKPSAPQKPSRSRSRENSSSTRNRITSTEHKLTYAERKGGSKRTQATQQVSRPKQQQQQSTTNAPTTIKLTEAEGSSLYIGGRTTTPPPPTTPDPGTDFKCEDEGFFQHPRDCKKYYWCLDSGPSGLGIVAHQFTCPSGLYFNPAADSCDFARNVPCKTKKSTTAAPITSAATTTTTTTARPTAAFTRLTAAPSRSTTFFRTTPKTTTTTKTLEEDIEYEEEEDIVPSTFAKHKGSDKESEEDPKVIKELIELIRKVGGIEELEKHLLRKDDGTISIKENSSNSFSSLAATTPSSISKSLYEKVLSKPNALNSFRNRFTSTSSFRTTKTQTQTETQNLADSEDEESHESDIKNSETSSGLNKYSSVLRGNSRQGPQNEGIEKLSDFEGFQKEKKQYITINRNRGTTKNTNNANNEEVDKESEDDEEEDASIETTRRPFAATTPSYSTIRRTRPLTTTEATQEEEIEKKEVNEKKSYSSLNRSRVRGTTTTEVPEVTAGSTRYKYLERTRPTQQSTTESSNKVNDDEEDDDDDDDDYESEKQEKTDTSTITPPPSTTLLHIFTIPDDAHTTSNPLDDGYQVGHRLVVDRVKPKHKVVEINRIVEINSKEEKLRRKSKANTVTLVEGSQSYKVESLPHVEQLGEISVVKYVHQVDGGDITIEGRSTVTDYTPTEPTIFKVSQPVRHTLPDGTVEERHAKALLPEVIREAAEETSTISLEGLFENARRGKVLNTIDDVDFIRHDFTTESSKAAEITEIPNNYQFETTTQTSAKQEIAVTEENFKPESSTESFNILKSVAFDIAKVNLEPNSAEIEIAKNSLETSVSSSSTRTTSSNEKQEFSTIIVPTTTPAPEILNTESSTVATEITKATTVAAALFPQYVRPIVPLIHPESNESSPLVISIANLDKVILSKVKTVVNGREEVQQDEQQQKQKENNIIPDSQTENPETITTNTNINIINNNSEQTLETQTETTQQNSESDDSNGAFSSRLASVVKAPLLNSLTQIEKHNKSLTNTNTNRNTSVNPLETAKQETHTELYTINEGNVGSTTSSTIGSKISEIVSFSSETTVVRLKQPRNAKSRKFKTIETTPATDLVSES